MSNTWGWHLVVDIKDASKVDDIDHIIGFLGDLIERIEMEAVGSPIVMNFEDLEYNKNGWTVLQLIKTSSITCHFCNTGEGFIDVFSCKEFAPLKVIGAVDQWFVPDEIHTRLLERGKR